MRREVGLYTRSVQWAKIALPILALGLFSSVFLVSEQDVFEGTGIVFSEADLSALGEGIQIKSPRFSGITDKGDKFLLTATSANPDSNKPSVIGMVSVAATLDLASGESIDLTAGQGELLVPTQMLTLEQGVTIASTEGLRGRLQIAVADLRKGIVTSDRPVEITGPMGQINAEAMEFRTVFDESGKIVQTHTMQFRERVKLVFHPNPVRRD